MPRLELAAAQACTAAEAGLIDLAPWEETEDPFELVAAKLEASDSRPEVQIGALGGAWGRLGGLLVSDRLWATHLLRLQAALPDAAFGLASTILTPLRALKDAEEIDLLRRAAHAADRVVEQIAAGPLVGRSEAEVSKEVRDRLIAEGHDEPSFAIVASGPNSASPHHEASDKVIAAGDPIVLDIGGRLEGYCSDTTRTLWVTGEDDVRPSDEFTKLYDVLQHAQAAAMAAVRPGLAAADLDGVARQMIAKGGYGAQFIHRTGHGIGLDGHEDPYIVESNPVPLVAGNAFSIEPGIYFDGKFGARIEDIVVCAADGADALNLTSRDLYVVRG
jgi:Xaa-Pro aminopeptidase